MSVRANRNLVLKERKVFTFDGFKGVDFTTSPYKVAGNRATQAKNLIYEDGTVRKRNGWESVCRLNGRISGLFSFEIDGEKIVLCYADKRFYRLIYNQTLKQFVSTDITETCTFAAANLVLNNLVDNRIDLYVNKKKAYIVGCGDYLVFGKWNGGFELRRVYDNEDTHIPITTTNIDIDGVNDEVRASVDSPNLLSSFRRNEFLGIDAPSGIWTVDTAIDGVEQAIDNASDIEVKILTFDTTSSTLVETVLNNRMTNKTNLYKIGDNVSIAGTVNFTTGKITLNLNTKPYEEDTSNITVTFKKSVEGQDDMLSKATISTLFGGNGASNRLFVSGNKDNKSVHIWSEIYDFTYFPDTNYHVIGNDGNAIVGYVRATDGTLLVFKEKNGSDSTIYYLTGEDSTIENYGDPVFTSFYIKAGSASDTILAKHATSNLNGDNLIVTRSGVKGIQLHENISIESYRLQERGRNINGKLLGHSNLSEACGFVFNDKYYLSVADSVYIADSRFTFQSEDDINGSYNYEWWYWDNVDARVWCEIDGELYFGTSEGLICKFYEGYADITFQDTKEGDLLVSLDKHKIAFNKDLFKDFNEDDELDIFQSEIYSLFLNTNEIMSDADGFVVVPENRINDIFDGIKLYADRLNENGLEVDKEYTIGYVDRDNLRFQLLLNGVAVNILKGGFRLSKKVSNKPLYISNVDYEADEFSLKEYPRGAPLEFVLYNFETSKPLLATIKYKKNIRAEWYTPIYDLGTNMFSKTLFNLTISTEPLVKNSISMGYQTKNLESSFTARGGRGFDFNDIDFEDFSFENSFASSYTIRAKERNFNFIMVRYVSDNQNSCAVNSISIRYKINQLNKGVR